MEDKLENATRHMSHVNFPPVTNTNISSHTDPSSNYDETKNLEIKQVNSSPFNILRDEDEVKITSKDLNNLHSNPTKVNDNE